MLEIAYEYAFGDFFFHSLKYVGLNLRYVLEIYFKIQFFTFIQKLESQGISYHDIFPLPKKKTETFICSWKHTSKSLHHSNVNATAIQSNSCWFSSFPRSIILIAGIWKVLTVFFWSNSLFRRYFYQDTHHIVILKTKWACHFLQITFVHVNPSRSLRVLTSKTRARFMIMNNLVEAILMAFWKQMLLLCCRRRRCCHSSRRFSFPFRLFSASFFSSFTFIVNERALSKSFYDSFAYIIEKCTQHIEHMAVKVIIVWKCVF